MAKNQHTFAKRQREIEKRRKAEEKRERRRQKKVGGDGTADETSDAETPLPPE